MKRTTKRQIRWDRIAATAILLASIAIIAVGSKNCRNAKKEEPHQAYVYAAETTTTSTATSTTVTTITTSTTTVTTKPIPIQRVEEFYGEKPETVWGIDISNYQLDYVDGEFLDKALEKGLSFVIIEVQRNRKGLEDLSTSALHFAELCEERNIPFGWYALVGAVNEHQAYEELKNLNNFLFEVDGKFSMNVFPTAIDIEADSKDFAQRCEWGQWTARRTKLLNGEVMFYTSASAAPKLSFRGETEFLWVAHYKARADKYCNSTWSDELLEKVAIWQYSDDNHLEEDWGVECEQGLDRDLMSYDFFLDHVG